MTRLALIAFAASAMVPAAALAQSANAEVRFDDLNLSNPAGVATLETRIEIAARQVCRGSTATGSRIIAARQQRACMADVRRQIEEQMAEKKVATVRN